jgi:hypothetical protein
VVFGIIGPPPRASRRLRSMMVAMGLLTSSALLVHLTGGLIESHFHFFVIVPLLTLYGDWSVFLLAIGYVAVHHGVFAHGSDRCIQPSPGLETVVEVGLDSCCLRAGASATALVPWRATEERALRDSLKQLPNTESFWNKRIERVRARSGEESTRESSISTWMDSKG